MEEGNSKAFPFIKLYIHKAQSEKKYDKLVQGYKDGIFFSSLNPEKLKYADSMIYAAKLSRNPDLISAAYIDKGVIYYYHYKKFQQALNEYLKAYEYSKNSENEFLKYQNLYHIGVVKSYLGHYEEAAGIFRDCIAYYRSKIDSKLHPNEIYNNKKGYFNSLHQLVVCYRNVSRLDTADIMLRNGLGEIGLSADYRQEKGYFQLNKGILEYKKNKYKEAVGYLSSALESLQESGDFAWLSVNYFYIGKSFWALNNHQEAIHNFEKVDSVFRKNQFILPELRENYELLINHYKKEKDRDQQLYYTSQLLKADSIISKDFIYLSSKIHKEYDTKTLLDEKNDLEKKNSWGAALIIILIALAIGLMVLLILRHKKEKDIQQKYNMLEEKLRKEQLYSHENPIPQKEDTEEKKNALDETIVEELLKKLKIFEDKKKFTQQGLTLHKLSGQLGTNSKYLSQVINDCKGTNFNKYLSELRINYITKLLFENKEYLKYNIETLAKECGMASRQNFSDLFTEINGIRPTDFIRKRKQELDNGNSFSKLKSV
ncbi:helix-turn-helix domain-containing protein [Chryseobacterium sp. MYb264]|uniref:helix-turn-helix domain-containing protein n=1 Tax=Chryseobacterium sp. MYb264 TaxID=2745153 RepID=UPI002E0FCD9A|nr:helix-turn-helix domain-containing protein [Chryseobacterium sp. MYb264]